MGFNLHGNLPVMLAIFLALMLISTMPFPTAATSNVAKSVEPTTKSKNSACNKYVKNYMHEAMIF